VGGDLNLSTFLNVITWANAVPCGCFLWDMGSSVLVDYNTITTPAQCRTDHRAGLICKSTGPSTDTPTLSPTKPPTKSPVGTPTVTTPVPTTPTSSPPYILYEKSGESSCPSGTEPVSQGECLEAAGYVGEGLNLSTFLNVITWANAFPCGCFLFDLGSSVIVDYNTISDPAQCRSDFRSQLICKSTTAP